MAPIAELVRGDGTIAKSIPFNGDAKVIRKGIDSTILVNTESGHAALSSLGNNLDEELHIISDQSGLVVDGLYPTDSATIPPKTNLVIHHDTHHETESKLVPEVV